MELISNQSINSEDDTIIDNLDNNFSINYLNNDEKFTKVKIISNLQKEKKNENIVKFTYKIRSNILPLIFFLGWIILYLISLRSCPTSDYPYKCDEPMNRFKLLNRLYFIIGSSLAFIILIILVIFKNANKFYFYFSLIILFFLCYYWDTGDDNLYHGLYNRNFFYFIIFIISGILFSTYSIIFCFNKKPILTIIILSILSLIIYLKIIKPTITHSCEYWDKGFKNSSILDESPCYIPKPEICHLKILSGVFDMSRLIGIDCKNYQNEKENILLKEWSNKTDAKILSFPRTEKMKMFPDSTIYNLQNNIFKLINNSIENSTEVYIDFTKDYPEVKIELKKNETLIKERKSIYESKKEKILFKNVLYIYIDSISRNHFKRKMPKTLKFFEQFYENKTSEYSSYQFLKYHALTYYTFPNMVPSSFGVYHDEEKSNYYLHEAKNAGYITGQAYDVCSKEIFDIFDHYEYYYNFTSYDHEFFSLYCDPNYAEPNLKKQENYYLNMNYQPLIGAYSIKRRCLYGKDAAEYQIEYTKQFFEAYKNEAKLFRLSFIDSHEFTGEVVKYLDDSIFEMLNHLKSYGHLDDTLVMFQSDHGLSIQGIYSLWEPRDYYYEIFLPCLFYLLPKNIPDYEEINENLKFNENIMTTPFDLNSGLINIFDKENTIGKYGVSLFSNMINKDMRNCELFRIKDKYCMCRSKN